MGSWTMADMNVENKNDKGASPSIEAAGSTSLDRGMFGSARSIFYIERGFPAEREIGVRETNRSVVHNISTIGNRTRFVC
jgi:hypothetical protein